MAGRVRSSRSPNTLVAPMPTTHSMRIQIWMPFAFAALLSGMKLCTPNGAGDPAFFSFLPMCFFGVAASQSAIVKRLAALEGSATQTSVRASPRLEIEMHGDGSV